MLDLLQQSIRKLADCQQARQISDGEATDLLCIDQFRVLFGSLSGAPQRESESILEQMQTLYKRALEVRGGLTQAGASDLYLFIVGPPGSASDPEWESLAYEIELDERVCRKLVWLPDERGEEVDDFIRRTFLARPWKQTRTGTVHTLGKLTQSVNVPPEWMKILLETDLDGRELIEALIQGIGDDQ